MRILAGLGRIFVGGVFGAAVVIACVGDDPVASDGSDGGSAQGTSGGTSGGNGNADGSGNPSGEAGGPGADGGAPVTAIVVDGKGTPVSEIAVLFAPPAGGGEGAIVRTDPLGRATHALPAGGSVTIARTTQIAKTLVTVFDVAPGEVIRFEPERSTSSSQSGHVVGTIQPPTGGAVSFSVDRGCSGEVAVPKPGNVATYDLPLSTLCKPDSEGKYMYLYRAIDGQGKTTAWSRKEFMALTDAGTTTIDVLVSDWSASPAASTMTITGTRPDWANTFPAANVRFPTGDREYAAFGATVPGSTFSYTTPPFSFTTYVEAQLNLVVTSEGFDWLIAHTRRLPTTTPVTDDLGSLLPRVTDVVLAGASAAPIVSWKTATPISDQATGAVLIGQNTGSTRTWLAVFRSPANVAASIALPSLPAELADYLPPTSWIFRQIGFIVSADAPFANVHLKPVDVLPLNIGSTPYFFIAQKITGPVDVQTTFAYAE